MTPSPVLSLTIDMKTISLKPSGVALQPIYVGEGEPTIPTDQKTINHTNPANRRHPRNIQVSNEYIFVKRYGSPTVAIDVDDFVQLCCQVEPKLSWAPLFLTNVVTNGNPVTIESQFETHNPELSEADNAITYKWQRGEGHGSNWQDMQDDATFSGCQTNKLTVSKAEGAQAILIRCVATNAAGSRSSLPAASFPPPNGLLIPKPATKPVNPPLVAAQ